MKSVLVSGIIEYRFDGFEMKLPDSIDLEDDDEVMDYIEANMDFQDVRQHTNTEPSVEIHDYDASESYLDTPPRGVTSP